ncbi:MAG TPA: DUF3828 domain-containing protein [Xanthobacteraceae bacterium]|jgi:hypothetical protein|nr:DUF3828 domain-containing protein [Xanthobacteraceae bacterium]
MLTRRILLLCAASLAVTASAKAENAKPDDGSALTFVKAIYAPYKGKNTKGIALDSDAQLRRYFEPSLVALISKDRKDAARRHDVPTLDGDPFIDAQDWEIPSFDITVNDAGGGKATSIVKFVNAGEPVTISLDLVSTGNAAATSNSANASNTSNAWRIHDITYQHDGKPETLRGLFAH